MHDFAATYELLTGNKPFPWQTALYERFVGKDSDRFPATCNLPTGLGKTSLIVLWLIALANRPNIIPRRLVYVVNRRTVVDQTTNEVEKLSKSLIEKPELAAFHQTLADLCGLELKHRDPSNPTMISPLAISTLRGQYADNRAWSADPARPAVICGTVDMIGSRLLFNGYGIGSKQRPLQAGFLGQDVLLIHDEAHLEPAFQSLLERIVAEQRVETERFRVHAPKSFQVIELSATSRSEEAFGLTARDRGLDVVKKRLEAEKIVTLKKVEDGKLVQRIADHAQQYTDSGQAILVFVREVDTVNKLKVEIEKKITKQVQTLTGTMRGYEREKMAKECPIFQRFLPESNRNKDVQPTAGTVFLICTSAGEVGVNISADHLLCDLSTMDSMAQRFGRVNRFGEQNGAQIDVFAPTEFDEKSDYDLARQKTMTLLRRLEKDGSPGNVSAVLKAALEQDELMAAFAPTPKFVTATDIQFDRWAMTTIRDLPGRPPVDEYLHGISEWEPPETKIAWREEVGYLHANNNFPIKPELAEELLELYPVRSWELLQDSSKRVKEELKKIQRRLSEEVDCPIWMIDRQSHVQLTNLNEILDQDAEELRDCTLLLPPRAGGLSNGLLDGTKPYLSDDKDSYDISGKSDTNNPQQSQRLRHWSDESAWKSIEADSSDLGPIMALKQSELQLLRTFDFQADDANSILDDDLEDADTSEDQPAPYQVVIDPPERYWHWIAQKQLGENLGSRTNMLPVDLYSHIDQVADFTKRIAQALRLPSDIQQALIVAAEMHDLGKTRNRWQRGIGNPTPKHPLAKSGLYPMMTSDGKIRMQMMRAMEDHTQVAYRHELGSLLDMELRHEPKFENLPDEHKDLVRHLVAAHHGYARPHFPADYLHDPLYDDAEVQEEASKIPRRFARLQRKYGRWGLAYLESILRAADWAASANPEKVLYDTPEEIKDALQAQRQRERV